MLILTVTINPSVDRNIEVDRLVFEDRAYILSRSDSAGGRGMNASRVLHSFGAKTLAIVTSGGANGQRLEKLAAKSGFPVKVVPIHNDIRVNLTITDKQGLAIRLNERGPQITPEELTGVEKAVANHLESASWLMLCGSIPPGVSTDFYTKLIGMARERKGEDAAGYRRRRAAARHRSRTNRGEPESARSGTAAESRADHAGAISGGGHAHQSHGRGGGDAVAGRTRRGGGE